MALNWREDREYLALVEDLLATEEVQRLESYVHHKVTNRLAHSISVSYRSYRWAKKLGLDTRAIARAGLLHDLFFYESADKGKVGGKGHNFEHPRIALENARKLTEISDLEADIILKHMCGATFDIPKYKESWIVTLMDKESAICEFFTGVKERAQAERNVTVEALSYFFAPLRVSTVVDEATLNYYTKY
ncbi:phosphohydrolase [Suicoccus acidiformans]|uniref:Phosphohydrolase n=1 Tax=Suicoccus acidiformans TaxID=2036206 RepID=A0A347WJS6_9LACT|nr:HD domain-containing protein [Suicoccus acidiformans]AXY25333.1 phosphohydrolase [Suicoccus acidiformans]